MNSQNIFLRPLLSGLATAALCTLLLQPCAANERHKPHNRTVANVDARQQGTLLLSLKERLALLRDVTLKGLLPTQEYAFMHETDWDTTSVEFDPEHQLFRPVGPESNSDKLKKVLKQQLGLQIGPNTQFQCDLQRYWTVDDHLEVQVKLGLNFHFR